MARSFPVPRPFASGNWGGLSTVGDRVLFGLCSHRVDEHVALCSYVAGSEEVIELAGLDRLLAGDEVAVAHGKIHTPFHAWRGRAYFGTHLGYYRKDLGARAAYRGGRVISVDLDGDALRDHGVAVPGEGIIASELDRERGILYLMTWPGACLVAHDLARGTFTVLGRYRLGDRGDTVCRAMVCVPGGRLVFCQADGSVHLWDPDRGRVHRLEGHLRDALAGAGLDAGWDDAAPAFRHMWHPATLDARDGTVLAIVHHAGALVRIVPTTGEVRLVDQIVGDAERGRAPSGSTSLTLAWGPGRVLYHVGTDVFESDGATRVRARLLSHDLERGVTVDHGRIVTDDGRDVLYAQTLAATSDGRLACVAWVVVRPEDRERFLASRPAKVDVGIAAADNPYEMRFLLLNMAHTPHTERGT